MSSALDMLSIDRKKHATAMAENLATLRTKLAVTQDELASLIGVTRQTISAIENKSRELTWTNFLSLLFLFTQSEKTKDLLPVLGIYTEELAQFLSFTDLRNLK